MILLNSSVLIELFRKPKKQNTLFYKLTQLEESFSISSITHYEIGIGNKDSKDVFWNSLIQSLTVVPFDQSCSDSAIEIYLDLRKRNKMIELADLLIGATAVTYDYPLATINRKHC